MHVKGLPEPVHMSPYYFEGVASPGPYAALDADLRCDLCIVGAGVTGVSAALHAARRGLKVVVLEGATACWAASGRNAGYMIPYVDYDPGPIANALGSLAAAHYWQVAHEAVRYLPELIQDLAVECDLQLGLLMAARKESTWARLKESGARFTREFGMRHVTFPDAAEMRSLVPQGHYAGGLLHQDVPTLHPVKMVYGLLRAAVTNGAQIHERTEVVACREYGDEVRLTTSRGSAVTARHVLLAGNAYARALVPSLAKRFVSLYTNMIGTEPLSSEQARSVLARPYAVLEAEAATSVVFRLTPDRRLLFGAGGPFVGRDGTLVRKLLTRALVDHFPSLEGIGIPHVWGGWFGMTAFSDTPDIGRLSTRISYAQAIPVVWAVTHGRLFTEALVDPGSDAAKNYDLLASIDVPPGPGGNFVSSAVRVAADAVAKVRALVT